MKKVALTIITLFLGIFSLQASAANLMQAYLEAAACDPTFKAAEALYLANRENYPIARSYLLPSIIANGSIFRQRITNTSGPDVFTGLTFYNTETIYALTLTQPIFNFAYWASFSKASYFVKQSEADFCFAQQDLMLRVARAYFAVLQANDNLRYTRTEKLAVARQLDQTKQQFEVGLIAITAFEEARAKYASILAAEIAARRDLADALERLAAITGKRYACLMGLNSEVPLIMPHPDDILVWVHAAEMQNFQLRSAVYNATVAQENIKQQFARHLPVINLQTDYTATDESNRLTFTSGGFSQSDVARIGVTASLPIFQGGLVNAQTRQAEYQYDQAIALMEQAHRQLIADTRDAYLGVVSGMSTVRADRATVASNRSALQATQNAYEAGTRTMTDVLRAQSTLYESQKTYMADQYAYLINTLTLKQAAGTLSPADLEKINGWLTKQVDIAGKLRGVARPVINKQYVSQKRVAAKKLKEITPSPIETDVSTHASIPSEIPLNKDWLDANSENYTLELFDTKVEKHAASFIRRYHMQGKAVYYSTKTSAGMRYRVIYGNYATVTEAQSAILKLPPDLGKLHPWIRKFARIKAEIFQ